MADIRINALPTTATDFASDDYIAIDGTTNGTRKLNAKTANLTFSDVTLGTSGPSVKSTLSARAPRQGLVFDGTAGTTVSVPAFGTSDFTIDAVANTNDATAANYIVAGITGSFYALSLGNGSLYFYKGGGTARNVAGVFTSKKTVRIAISKSSGVISTYVNGVLIDTWTDANDATGGYTQPISGIGGTSTQFWVGYLSVNIYNRALSASEVVALYEAGAPSGADYNSASNTSVVTGFTQSGQITSFTANATSWSGTGTAYAEIYPTGAITSLTVGKRYRLVIGTVTGTIFASGGVSGSALTSNTTYDFTATATSVVFFTSTVGSIGITGISLTKLGLLLAPDAAQAGGGLTWYDTSGNAANITLPASGVSWNVPSSGYWGGNLTVSGTGTSSFGSGVNLLSIIPSTGICSFYSTQATPSFVIGNTSAINKYGQIQWINSVSQLSIGTQSQYGTGALNIATNGNVLIGTTTDSGNGKLQLATHTTSAGGIGFGTDVSLYRAGASTLKLELGVSSGALLFDNGGLGTGGARVLGTSGALTVTSNGSNSLYLQTGGTTALTLDSSQNATFAGNYVYIGGGTSFYLRATGSGNGLWYGNNASFDGNSFSLRNQAGTVTNHSFDSSKVFIANTQAVPATPTGGGHLYVEGGALKYKGSSGTVTTIANA